MEATISQFWMLKVILAVSKSTIFTWLIGTLTALIEATNSWSVNIDNGLVNGVIFIDLKKNLIHHRPYYPYTKASGIWR